ncbi:membrane dipeptidase [uncultured Sunxiuqinia sp.]|uniref:membrane dipeptidase n=1 Tax=uncultured Sunxiuqinia sp. TaxID=1573825 RepID=UPI002AA83599|nr:membrane dipeptidase [uncultured Sunxiuqinia sp.]
MKQTILLFLLSLGILFAHAQEKDQRLWKKALRIHERVLTIDTHCDTPMEMIRSDFDIGDEHQSPDSRVDLPRMKAGGLGAMFFAVWIGQKPRTDENYIKAYQLAHQMLDSIHSAGVQHQATANLALTADQAATIESAGKRAIYIGLENGFP